MYSHEWETPISLMLVIPNKSMVAQTSRESLAFDDNAHRLLKPMVDEALVHVRKLNQSLYDAWDVESQHSRPSPFGQTHHDGHEYTYRGESMITDNVGEFFQITLKKNSVQIDQAWMPSSMIASARSSSRMLVTHAGDFTEREIKGIIRHYLSEHHDEFEDDYSSNTYVDVTVRPFGPKTWEKVVPAKVTIDAREFVSEWKKAAAERRALQAELRRAEKISRLKNHGIDVENPAKVTTKIFETRETFNGPVTMMTEDEIINAHATKKKPIIYIVSAKEDVTRIVTTFGVPMWAENSKRLIVEANNPVIFARRLREKHGIETFCPKGVFDAQGCRELEWKHAEPILRRMLEGINYDPEWYYELPWLRDFARMARLSDVKPKNATLKKFINALETKHDMLEVVVRTEGRLDEHGYRRHVNDKSRFNAWVDQHSLISRITYEMRTNKKIASDIMLYINAKKVKM